MSAGENASRTTLEYHIVDVFTDTPLTGNPLAVVFDTAGLSTGLMQSIAREFNLSETTFVQRRAAEIESREGLRVRIFTTQEELPFAGHPTLGTASVLRLHAPETLTDNTIALALNVGPVPVRFQGDSLFGEMTQRDPEFGPELSAELDSAEVARLCGLAVGDLDPALPPQIVSTGTAFAIVALRSVEALARLKVRQDEASPWLRERGARWFYVLAPEAASDAASDDRAPFHKSDPKVCCTQCWRARMQFNGGEDPATGSAAGCAIAYLVSRRAVPSGERIHVRQGVEMGRSSDLFLSAQIGSAARVVDVRVAGSTVPVASGHISVP